MQNLDLDSKLLKPIKDLNINLQRKSKRQKDLIKVI